MHAGGAFVLHDLCAQTLTCGTTNDGVNDPVSAAWGHLLGRTAGSFHAIVGSATAKPTEVTTAAQSAASMSGSQQVAAKKRLNIVRGHGATRGEAMSWESVGTGGPT